VLGLNWLLDGKASRVFCLGSGQGYSVREVIAAAAKVTNRVVPVIEGARRDGDAARLVSGSLRAERELGWTPHRSNLSDMIHDAHVWASGPGFAK
jgi:UDP-glucose 4-epimerase